MEQKRSNFSGSLGFVLAAAGSAVGAETGVGLGSALPPQAESTARQRARISRMENRFFIAYTSFVKFAP